MYTGLNYYIHKSLDNGNGALWLVPSQLDLSSYVEKFKMAAKFAEPTEVEIAGPAEPVRLVRPWPDQLLNLVAFF